jgi:hypothetical protein
MIHEDMDVEKIGIEQYLGNDSELEGVVYGWVKSEQQRSGD